MILWEMIMLQESSWLDLVRIGQPELSPLGKDKKRVFLKNSNHGPNLF